MDLPHLSSREAVRKVSRPMLLGWGGADGGAYVRCSVDREHDVNKCSVWNDHNGALIESGNYRLRGENRAATESELHVSFPDVGGLIYLEGGLVLQRVDR